MTDPNYLANLTKKKANIHTHWLTVSFFQLLIDIEQHELQVVVVLQKDF